MHTKKRSSAYHQHSNRANEKVSYTCDWNRLFWFANFGYPIKFSLQSPFAFENLNIKCGILILRREWNRISNLITISWSAVQRIQSWYSVQFFVRWNNFALSGELRISGDRIGARSKICWSIRNQQLEKILFCSILQLKSILHVLSGVKLWFWGLPSEPNQKSNSVEYSKSATRNVPCSVSILYPTVKKKCYSAIWNLNLDFDARIGAGSEILWKVFSKSVTWRTLHFNSVRWAGTRATVWEREGKGVTSRLRNFNFQCGKLSIILVTFFFLPRSWKRYKISHIIYQKLGKFGKFCDPVEKINRTKGLAFIWGGGAERISIQMWQISVFISPPLPRTCFSLRSVVYVTPFY